ncbi:MAG: A24 family peptidase [Planctomycetes bacterium]|jgi:Flp pilus assembly protein protease CpaA|nr:A24 family peptidase [Planctomycetota bacterium]
MSFVWLVPGALLLIAAFVDMRKHEVPDVLPLGLLAWAVLSLVFGWLDLDWWSVPAGAVAGLVVGAVLFRLGGFGGGDAKLLAALGAFLGPAGFLVTLMFIFVAGGVLALVSRLRSRREHAYAPAIAAGYAVFLVLGGVVHGSI